MYTAYRTRSNYSNILNIRTVNLIILFLSNTSNMPYFDFSHSFYLTEWHTPSVRVKEDGQCRVQLHCIR